MKLKYSDIKEILTSPCVHPWVKLQFAARVANADPVDAVMDAELLAAMLQARLEVLQGNQRAITIDAVRVEMKGAR